MESTIASRSWRSFSRWPRVNGSSFLSLRGTPRMVWVAVSGLPGLWPLDTGRVDDLAAAGALALAEVLAAADALIFAGALADAEALTFAGALTAAGALAGFFAGAALAAGAFFGESFFADFAGGFLLLVLAIK
ncbi:MAG: hypothetical protein ABI883_00380 [Chthoniobacterales bacterium]